MEKILKSYIYKAMLIMTVFLMPFPYFALNTAYAVEKPVAPSSQLVLPEKPIAPIFIKDVPATPAPTDSIPAPEKPSQIADINQSEGSLLEIGESLLVSPEKDELANSVADPILDEAGDAVINNRAASNSETSNLNQPNIFNDPNKTTVNNGNNTTLNNGVKANIDTGNNEANYNTGDGTVSTGDANLVLSIVNMVNTIFVSAAPSGIRLIFDNIFGDLLGNYIFDPFTKESYSLTGSRLDISNSNTGPESSNTAYLNSGQDTNVLNTQNAIGDNQLDLSANTGNNSASYNTGSGDVATGDANVSLNLLNFFNSSFYTDNQGVVGVLNVFGDLLGNLVIPKSLLSLITPINNQTSSTTISNNNTGPGSENNASAEITDDVSLSNNNDSDIQNVITVGAETGQSEASYNTGNGSVTTGESNADLNIENTANQNIAGDFVYYLLINVMGDWTGQNMIPFFLPAFILPNNSGEGLSVIIGNTNTGPGSTNDASLDADNSLGINNNNTSNIQNNIVLSANTGGNNANYNTGSGSVKTGDANVLANILNFANVNVVSKNFMFFVINIFGDWKGDITDDVVDGGNNDNGEPVVDNGNTGYEGGEVYDQSGISRYSNSISGKPRALLVSYLKVSDLEDSPDSAYVLGTSTDKPDGLYSFSSNNDNKDETLLQYLLNNFGIYLGSLVATLALIYFFYNLRNRKRLSNFGNNLIERR